jgi:hypothetical protein
MHRSLRSLLAALLVACGGKDGDTMTDESTAADATSGTDQPTTGATTTTGTSTTDASTTDASTTDDLVCDPPSVSPLGVAVTIELMNMRAEPIYIDGTLGCEPVTGYQIFPEGSGTALDLDASCRFDCPTVLSGVGCECALGCPIDQVRRIDPGATFKAAWNGGEFVPVTLSDGCAKDPCVDSCIVSAGVPAGGYELRVPASTTVECESDCTCPPNEMPCLILGARGPSDVEVTLAFNYPEQTALMAAFE